MKMKRLPYKRLIAGVTRQVKFYLKHQEPQMCLSAIYADPFTGDVRLDDCPEQGNYYSVVALFLTDAAIDQAKRADTAKIEHWVRVDLRHYAERVFQNECNLKKLFGATS